MLERAYTAYQNPISWVGFQIASYTDRFFMNDTGQYKAMNQIKMAVYEDNKYSAAALLKNVLERFSDKEISPKHHEYATKIRSAIKAHDFRMLICAIRLFDDAALTRDCRYDKKILWRDLHAKLDTIEVTIWSARSDRELWTILEGSIGRNA